MTAAAHPAGQNQPSGMQTAAVPLRRLMRVTLRQHQTALLWAGVVVAVLAIVLAATGVSLHGLAARGGPGWFGASRASVDYGGVLQAFALALQLAALLAGMFLGAPLLPREIGEGTAKLAWTQAASRTRWLLAQVLPLAGLLALTALAIGAEFGWWLSPFPDAAGGPIAPRSPWWPLRFNLSPLLLAGWVVFAFTLGVLLGAVIRQTLPAMAATLVCYGTILFEVSASWRMHYLAPLHRAVALQFQSAGSYGYSLSWGRQQPVIMSRALGWPDGRLLSDADRLRSAGWMRLHHILMWITYQPGSRHHIFQAIELGWLLAASALLVAAAILVTRRRPA
ncbi:MAG TPA: hypothetical protein VMA73_17685 [Streptosporangiaceae bacterium]|nr:hypothetical protein [Streptosporangiaceae bacterium]